MSFVVVVVAEDAPNGLPNTTRRRGRCLLVILRTLAVGSTTSGNLPEA